MNRSDDFVYAKVIADSISPDGDRITTFEKRHHRWVLAEENTHAVMCLAGDVELWFDRPNGVEAGRAAGGKMRIDELFRKWHSGTRHSRRKRGKFDTSLLVDDRDYRPAELAKLLGAHYTGFDKAVRLYGLPARSNENGRRVINGADFKRWYSNPPEVEYNTRTNLSRMWLRCLNEETGEIVHTHVKDVWESGEKETYTVEFDDGYVITTSKAHLFFTDRGWLTLEEATGLRRNSEDLVFYQGDSPMFAANGQVLLDRETVGSLRAEGMTIRQIADRLDVPRHRVERAYAEFGWKRVAPEKPACLDDPAWLLARRQEGSSATSIAADLGVTVNQVKRSFQRHKIPYDISLILKGRKPWNTGLRYQNPKTRGRRTNQRHARGAEHHWWKGGITSERADIGRWTQNEAYRVHQKFGFKCQIGGCGSDLVAHHIVPVVKDVGLAKNFDNLITLCATHHRYLHANNLEDRFADALHNGDDLSVFSSADKEPHPDWKPKARSRRIARKWVAIKAIRYAGVQMTYDIEVEGPWHNFVADGIVVHNSKNSASSRARPVVKVIDDVRAHPAVPVVWASERSGMQGGDPVAAEAEAVARRKWDLHREATIQLGSELRELGVHKSITNRLLEPHMMHVSVWTGPVENYFAQRCHPDAQPEIRMVAERMRDAYEASTPTLVGVGGWHLPYIGDRDRELAVGVADRVGEDVETVLSRVSAARVARTSYLTQAGVRDLEADLALFDRLAPDRLASGDPVHWSPLEQVLTPWSANRQQVDLPLPGGSTFRTSHLPKVGKFVGWVSMRHMVEAESRVVTFR